MDYYSKYLKYKNKYLEIKNNYIDMVGGAGAGRKKIKNNNEYTVTIKQPWFDLIKSGKKTIEGRLNSGLFARLKINDVIIWLHQNMRLKVKIIDIRKYDSFHSMLKKEGLDRVLPNTTNIDDGVKLYRQYYSEEKERNGVLAIEFEQNIFESKLQTPYYEYIKDGTKIYEMRVNDEKRQKMNIGDIWKFKHAVDETLPQYNTRIIDKKIYKSFEEAINETGYEKLLPNTKTKDEAIKIYNAFDNGNYELDAKKYGVVCFRLQVEH
jgi:ASC-1-like (ASCH) protein